MRLVSLGYILILCTGFLGCSEHLSYVICDTYCTPPLTHDEAMHAGTNEALYVRPGR